MPNRPANGVTNHEPHDAEPNIDPDLEPDHGE